jgi:hypothetical protein
VAWVGEVVRRYGIPGILGIPTGCWIVRGGPGNREKRIATSNCGKPLLGSRVNRVIRMHGSEGKRATRIYLTYTHST